MEKLAPQATATLLKKIKALARQLRRSQRIPLNAAQNLAAQSFAFRDYHQASAGLRLGPSPGHATGERGNGKSALDAGATDLVGMVRRLTELVSAGSSDEYYRSRLLVADRWRKFAAAASASDLSELQCALATDVATCVTYFEAVQTAIDLPPELNRFAYSGAVALNFTVRSWPDAGPFARMHDGARRKLTAQLREEFAARFAGTAQIRVARLAHVTDPFDPDIPGDHILLRCANSAFHECKAQSPPSPEWKGAGQACAMTVLVYLGVDEMHCSSWDKFTDEVLMLVGDMSSGYETMFTTETGSPIRATSLWAQDMMLEIGFPAWGEGVDRLQMCDLLPSPQGVTNENRRRPDPFLVRFEEVQRAALGVRRFIVSIAASGTVGRPATFHRLGTTSSPALCVGWINEWLSTIRAAGCVEAVTTVPLGTTAR